MRGRASFFYVRLLDKASEPSSRGGYHGFGPAGVDYVLTAYGVGRWLEDCDRGRDHLTGPGGTASDGNPSVVAEVLDWASGDGFGETIDRLTRGQSKYGTALQYRERYLLAALRNLAGR